METQKLLSEDQHLSSECKDHPDYQSVIIQNGSAVNAELSEQDTEPPSTHKTNFSPYQRKLLFSLALVALCNGSLIAVMIPFFPVEAASRGVSQMVISGVFSCYALAKVLINPLVGRLAPVVGVTRLYNYGLGLAGLSTVVFGALVHIQDTNIFMGAIFAARIVEAAGSSAITTCSYTIAGSQFGERVTTAVAVIGSSLTMGIALTPAIWGGLYALGGFGTPFYTLGVIMLVMAAVNIRLMPAIERSDCEQEPFFSTLRTFAGSVDNWLCLITMVMFAADITTVESSFAVYANDVLDVPPSLVGLFYLAATSAYAMLNFFWAGLSERLQNNFPMMSVCLFLSSIGILFIAPTPLVPLRPHWLITGLAMIFEDMFLGGAFTPCFKVMLDSSIAQGLEDSLSTKAFVSSMFSSVYSLGIAVGPVTGGAVVDKYGFPVMTTGLAFMTAFLAAVMALKVIIANRCRASNRIWFVLLYVTSYYHSCGYDIPTYRTV